MAYLQARGIISPHILARVGNNVDDFLAKVLKPYIDGTQIKEKTFKAEADDPVLTSCFTVLYEEA
eukprot:2655252-Amphidinium_carterae.2